MDLGFLTATVHCQTSKTENLFSGGVPQAASKTKGGVSSCRKCKLKMSARSDNIYVLSDRPTYKASIFKGGSCHKRQKTQASTPQAPIRNHQTRKVANAKGLNRNTNLT